VGTRGVGLEILHGLIGLVRSQLPATPRKIRSCLFVIWGILWSFSETRIHILVSSLVIRWDNTEVCTIHQ
uniref:Very-long-chain (3R)-3-hydroxyacyl-CoA dehydratase n=1 Tax=Triticum urartu TaxID=4572 RepID=A0A8R7UNS2_TRIUA